MRSVRDSPVNFFFGTERNESFLAEGVGCRGDPGFLDQRHGTRVARELIEVGAEVTGKIFEPAECLDGVEGFGVERECGMGRITACAATGRFFCVFRMRCRVGTEEKFRVTGGGCGEEGLSIVFALADRETVVVWSDASCEETISVVEEMMCGDRRGDVGTGCFYELDHFPGRDVFDDDTEMRMLSSDQIEGFDEARFPVENINFPSVILQGFTMDGKDEVVPLHSLEDRIEPPDVGYTGCGIGRGIGRVEFGCQDVSACGSDDDIRDRSVIGQVEGHEWVEVSVPVLFRVGIECLEDTATVIERPGGLFDRRFEIGHDERPSENLGGVGEY